MGDCLIALIALSISLTGAVVCFYIGQIALAILVFAAFLMCWGMIAMLKPTQKKGGRIIR